VEKKKTNDPEKKAKNLSQKKRTGVVLRFHTPLSNQKSHPQQKKPPRVPQSQTYQKTTHHNPNICSLPTGQKRTPEKKKVFLKGHTPPAGTPKVLFFPTPPQKKPKSPPKFGGAKMHKTQNPGHEKTKPRFFGPLKPQGTPTQKRAHEPRKNWWKIATKPGDQKRGKPRESGGMVKF